jgi:hypothetical protein
MGYYVFTLAFRNGARQAYLTGGAVDFVQYPEGLGKDDVVDVIPNTGRYEHINGPEYYWYLSSE